MKIGVCDWGCTLHTYENVESLWHAKPKEAKEKLKKKWWMTLGSRVRDIKIHLNIVTSRNESMRVFDLEK